VKLLVSVVSVAEARAALRGGADVIDVKDPSRGALGAPSPAVVAEIVAEVGGVAPVSVALGDLPATAPPVRGVAFVKAGLQGDVDSAVEQLTALRDLVGPETGVVAAAYADAERCGALPPSVLPEVVARAGIAGALVDTCVKDGRGLYAWVTPAELEGLIARTPGTFAVAGQLGLDELTRVRADFVGVRSAVCGGDRTGTLDAALVAQAQRAIRVPVPPGARTVTVTPVLRTASAK
jgi:(5-formylfuran-3-yl)methyl phosphate synthase